METVLKLNLIFVQIEVNVTKFLVELRFFLKFNLFLLPILLAGFGATSYVVWRQISTDAEQEALDKARVMLETAAAMRTYTTKQIAPVLDRDQSRLEEADKSLDRILNTQIPNAMKKAIAQMPSFRDQQALQGSRTGHCRKGSAGAATGSGARVPSAVDSLFRGDRGVQLLPPPVPGLRIQGSGSKPDKPARQNVRLGDGCR